MKKGLFADLMRFASSKKGSSEKIRYIFLAVAYYFFLAKNTSGAKRTNSASGNESGDDIYPLF